MIVRTRNLSDSKSDVTEVEETITVVVVYKSSWHRMRSLELSMTKRREKMLLKAIPSLLAHGEQLEAFYDEKEEICA